MLIMNPLQEGLITLPTNFAKIVRIGPHKMLGLRVPGIDDTKYYSYEFDIILDVSKLASSNAWTANVRLLSSPAPRLGFTPPAFSPETWASRSRNMETACQYLEKSVSDVTIHETIFDFTSDVSNAATAVLAPGVGSMGIANNPLGSFGSGPFAPSSPYIPPPPVVAPPPPPPPGCWAPPALPPETTGETFTLTSVEPLDRDTFSLPFNHFSIAPEVQTSLGSFASNLLETQKDPASITPKLLGVVQQPVAELMQSMMYTPPLAEPSITMLQVHSPVKRVKKRLNLSETQIGSLSKFTIEISIENQYGVEISKETTEVSHSRLVNEYLTPDIPPEIDVAQTANGQISVGVRQVDPKGTSVKVFRRVVSGGANGAMASQSLTATTNQWQVILEADLKKDSGERRFVDNIVTTKQVMYRALVYGENGKPAEDFSSKVITPKAPNIALAGTACSCVAMYSATSRTAKIRISDLPKKALSIGVKRFDVTFNSYSKKMAGTGKGFTWVNQTTDVGSDTRVLLSDEEEVTFYDSTVKVDNTYIYVPVITTLYGREEHGRSGLLEIPFSIDDDEKINMSMGEATIIEDTTGTSVSFEVAASFTDFGFNEIKTTLDAGGQSGLFGDQILENRGQFAPLLGFVVERENLSTGEVESFGIVQPGTFTDNATSRGTNNVKPMVPGQRYSYITTAVMNPAETLIDTLEVSEIDTQTLQSFTRNISKFRGPMQLRKSTLKSTQGQKQVTPSRIGPSNPILQGITTVNKSIDVSIAKPVSYSTPLTVQARPDNMTLNFSYSGRLSEVDHFQVYMKSDGGRAFVGTIHNDFTSPEFSYRHKTDGYSKDYSYEVVPINTSFEELESTESVSIPPQQLSQLSPLQVEGAVVIQK